MNIATSAMNLLQSGLGNLASYLAAHVLMCLVPAFFIAGALTALVPKESVTRYLGGGASRLISYPAAAIGGSILAVCSCTIMPLFAGIYRKGAGLLYGAWVDGMGTGLSALLLAGFVLLTVTAVLVTSHWPRREPSSTAILQEQEEKTS